MAGFAAEPALIFAKDFGLAVVFLYEEHKATNIMKKILCLAASLLALNLTLGFGQPSPTSKPVTPKFPVSSPQGAEQLSPEAQHIMFQAKRAAKGEQSPSLTKFNLDFPGGTPAELVKAIEKATGKPLNVIVSDDDANFKLPPLKLTDITFAQLSDVLREGSIKQEALPTYNQYGGTTGYYHTQTGYYFKTTDDRPTDNSVWFFQVLKAPQQTAPMDCRFYSLAPYLNRGFTVDDITTAIQTGWKMAGGGPSPELDYHKETNLLIAYGRPDKLKTINDVLNALPSSNVTVAKAAQYANAMDEASKNLQKARNQISELNFRIKKLEAEMGKLTSATNSAPAEKSGK